MQCGLFDHLDYRNEPPVRTYHERLALIRAAEQAGFRAYHLAEHHGTPLGMAPSPSVFLAAAARETRTLRLGAMVYCLPLYEPLRLLEEICMLDQLSDGRLEIGVGRGASPFEQAFFGVQREEAVERYVETLQILRQGLASELLNYTGRHFNYQEVPLPLRPRQDRIPFWSGPATSEAQAHAARDGMNIMVLGSTARVQEVCAGYRDQWQRTRTERVREQGIDIEPMIGAYRMVFVAPTDRQAATLARPAYDMWFEHLGLLWKKHQATTPFLGIGDFDSASAQGMVVSGCPARVRELLVAQHEQCGFNYAVLELAFGNLGHAAEMRSLELFAEQVLPAIAALP